MTDPLRGSERSPAAERLLARARRGAEPSAVDEARVRYRLHARILATPLLLDARGAHALGTASKLSAAKILIVVSVCGGTAAIAGVALKDGFGSQGPARIDARAASSARGAAQHVVRPSALETASVAPAPEGATQNDVPAAIAAPTPALKRPVSSVSPAATLSPQDIQMEIAGLQRAQHLLHSGNAARALVALDHLGQQVPAGALMDERDATRVIALCTLGRVHEAGIGVFLARHPDSVHSERVRAACGRASLE